MSEFKLYREVYDLMVWILNKTDGFRTSKRFSIGRRLEDVAVDLVVACRRYSYTKQRGRLAATISRVFDELKLLIQISYDTRLIGKEGYAHCLERFEHIGPMIGALVGSSSGQA